MITLLKAAGFSDAAVVLHFSPRDVKSLKHYHSLLNTAGTNQLNGSLSVIGQKAEALKRYKW